MIKGSGKVACKGLSVGRIYVYRRTEFSDDIHKEAVPEEELLSLDAALQTAKEQLEELYEKTKSEIGEEQAMIFEVHRMLLEDEDFKDSIREKITTQKKSAAASVKESGEEFAEMMVSMDDDYMKERAADFRDISKRVVRILTGEKDEKPVFEEPVVILAQDLDPSETVSFDKSMIKGFVLEKGSTNSHTAILARMLNVPSIVSTGMAFGEHFNGKMIIVNGDKGEFVIEPNEELLKEAEKEEERQLEEGKQLEEFRGKLGHTKDGKRINVFSNIGNVEDLEAVQQNDAEGIGLFRSEFLYLGRNNYPTEEEQFEAYKAVARGMNGKKVIIRTLDIGADKQVGYFNLGHEDNPVLGLRAIRICLSNKELFQTQLRAILRASEYGNISIMFPMIISEKEVIDAKACLEEAKRELTGQGLGFQNIELGIMIETPAAVMMAEELAKHVDFFSVGTNDLTQYTLAVDRQNERIESYYDAKHPAILKMLEKVARVAKEVGIWAGICGELAGDLSITDRLVKMGYEELSVAPSLTLKLRKRLMECESQEENQ